MKKRLLTFVRLYHGAIKELPLKVGQALSSAHPTPRHTLGREIRSLAVAVRIGVQEDRPGGLSHMSRRGLKCKGTDREVCPTCRGVD